MKNILKFLGIIALAAVIGFSMAACEDDKGGNDGGNGGDGDGGGSSEKSIKITDLDDWKGSYFELVLGSSISDLEDGKYVAYATGTIRSGTQTAALINYKTDKPWTGSGSYYVGVIIDDGYDEYDFVTTSKKSFSSKVTTLSIDDFEK